MEDYYKYNRAYYLRFKDVESDTYLNNYIFPNFAKILEESGMDAIAVEEDENGQDCMVLFLEDIKIKEFIEFCVDEEIIEHHQDITKQLLLHDNLNEVILMMIRSDEFEDKFNQFLKKNVTMDTILDKILLNGEESLSKFEFDFLKSEVARNRSKNLH